MTIADESATGVVKDSWRLEGLPEQATVREIIRSRVREEVARYNLSGRGVFSGLVQPLPVEAAANGYRETRMLHWERQAEVAERAFASNGFFMLVEDRQVESLDDLVDLRGDPRVAFIRLVQLVGG